MSTSVKQVYIIALRMNIVQIILEVILVQRIMLITDMLLVTAR